MSTARRRTSKRASFVVVANRLPVDRSRTPTAAWTGAPPPAAWSPPSSRSCARRRRRLGRLARLAGRRPRALRRTTACSWCRCTCQRRGGRALLRGLLQRTLWPLYHDVVAPPGVPPASGGTRYVDGQRALRRGGGARSPPRAPGLGAGLPAPARARRCCASCDPTCGSASSCTSRSRRPSCSSSCPGAARSCRGCWARTWSASSCPAAPRTSSGWCGSGSPTRPAGIGSSSPTVARCMAAAVPDRHRLTEHARAGQADATAEPGPGDPGAISAIRRPSSSASTGSTTPRGSGADPSLRRAGRRGQIDPEDAVLPAGRHPVPGAGRAVPAAPRRHRPAVGRINGDAGRIGRPPIIYLHTSYPARGDGRDLPGRRRHGRHPAARRDEPGGQGVRGLPAGDNGALVLSEFTGAAKELRQAYLVNPHDIDGLKSTDGRRP